MNDDFFRLPLGAWVKVAVDWITDTLGGVFDVIRAVFLGLYEAADWVLAEPPFWVILLLIAALAWYLRGPRFGITVGLGLFVIKLVNQWDNSMDTLALTIVSTVIAVAISIPLGIWAAQSDKTSRVVRPILDFLQTMPAFVYLIPAIILFRVGVVPGIVATIAFAMAPGVRLTELGIRGVDTEVVEAGQAFGASPRRILLQIQLPLAKPTIMAGINQVIMLSLSMVVIASMVGASGLGKPIIQALQRIDVGLGFEAGLAVVILAIMLDRLTATLGLGRQKRRARMPRNTETFDATTASEDAPVVPVGALAAVAANGAQSPIARDTVSGGKDTV
ncbi:MAG TPA: proline/glycine betaine ABC transporter permease [Terrimesophilobacter sp.]|nr:proline/glycine betaine ABC transporter permease [Terrimesophilobacter sp.]